jgi:hypothetical protein
MTVVELNFISIVRRQSANSSFLNHFYVSLFQESRTPKAKTTERLAPKAHLDFRYSKTCNSLRSTD